MSILVYALHYQGEFNKNSLGAVSEGAKLAKELGSECAAVVVGDGDDLTDDLCASLGRYGATKVFRARAPEGLAQPVVDVMAKVIEDNGFRYALFGGRLNGFDIVESDDGAAEVVDVDVDLQDHSTKARMVQRGEQRGADVNIEDAEILVAGGAGPGG